MRKVCGDCREEVDKKEGETIFGFFTCHQCLNIYFDRQERKIKYIKSRDGFER